MKLARYCSFFCLLALLCLPCPARGEEAKLVFTQFSVEKQDETLTLLSHIQLENPNMVRSQLRDGAQMILKGGVTLHRVRTLLNNELVGQGDLEIHLRHDPLRRDFIAFRGGKMYQSRNLPQALYGAWDAGPISIQLLTPLTPGEQYRLTMTLTLQHAEVPPWLEKALFFWSWDVVPPVEVTQDFQF